MNVSRLRGRREIYVVSIADNPEVAHIWRVARGSFHINVRGEQEWYVGGDTLDGAKLVLQQMLLARRRKALGVPEPTSKWTPPPGCRDLDLD